LPQALMQGLHPGSPLVVGAAPKSVQQCRTENAGTNLTLDELSGQLATGKQVR
jgi:hypothetical protein